MARRGFHFIKKAFLYFMKKNKRVASEYFFGLIKQTWKIGCFYFLEKLKLPLFWNHKKNLLIVLLITLLKKKHKTHNISFKKRIIKVD